MACFVFDAHMIDLNPLVSNALGGVKIKVREKDAEEAIRLIQALEDTPYTDDNDEVIACPKDPLLIIRTSIPCGTRAA